MSKKSEIEKFNLAFDALDKESKVAIFTHVTPDPDAIAAAVGLQWFLKNKYSLFSDIFYAGEISHPQNKTLVNVLSLDLKKAEEYQPDKYLKVLIVDCTEQHLGVKELDVDVVFDHHRNKLKKNESEYDFTDIRAVGATCSLIYGLMKNHDTMFDKSNPTEVERTIATAMLMGIKTDTRDLLSEMCTSLDGEAYMFLKDIAEISKLDDIINYPLPKYLFDLENDAIKEENATEINDVFISFIGVLSSTKRDALPHIADKMMRMQGVTTSIIFAIVEDEIQGCVRSKDVSLDVDAFVKKIFGKNAGGKYGAGAGKVDLGFFSISSQSEELKEVISLAVKQTVIAKIEKEVKGE